MNECPDAPYLAELDDLDVDELERALAEVNNERSFQSDESLSEFVSPDRLAECQPNRPRRGPPAFSPDSTFAGSEYSQYSGDESFLSQCPPQVVQQRSPRPGPSSAPSGSPRPGPSTAPSRSPRPGTSTAPSGSPRPGQTPVPYGPPGADECAAPPSWPPKLRPGMPGGLSWLPKDGGPLEPEAILKLHKQFPGGFPGLSTGPPIWRTPPKVIDKPIEPELITLDDLCKEFGLTPKDFKVPSKTSMRIKKMFKRMTPTCMKGMKSPPDTTARTNLMNLFDEDSDPTFYQTAYEGTYLNTDVTPPFNPSSPASVMRSAPNTGSPMADVCIPQAQNMNTPSYNTPVGNVYGMNTQFTTSTPAPRSCPIQRCCPCPQARSYDGCGF
ncbi:nascent polypeptide-associated complex subunit alpha, muscle-specific form-like isoform X3 [Aethina tumida]|uniref:nascent polypeptide-associated complex subunit alpha, muscle-specific form-like isoform X3 n=1 Tax=Aethina tumida TaxID=116153 RepID=UPI002148A138|nr:nascent polypeptide-associated complex subunit alpha, muscle-specific form-like isoform X3 [Aethina tumida]